MNLEAQIQLLIENAPKDGRTPKLVAAIAPALSAIAQQLSHSNYYVLQNLDQEWVVTTLSNRGNPQQQKRVVYAFSTLQDIPTSYGAGLDPQVIATPMPVTHILFQLMALEPVDSIVFVDTNVIRSTSTSDTNEIEIRRADLQNIIKQILHQKRNSAPVPPDIA
ncbi:hypothetical protein [Chlorogloeopsis sp. ULAP02]|uniref:hypothetical protein n=1 Tax=Chlorogloeopsis sp. ULAP02 TaxID=3107926 RepID=UPI0031354A3F